MLSNEDAGGAEHKKRRLEEGDPDHGSVTAASDVPPVKQGVRDWLAEIGLGQYADNLIEKGYDDLGFLQRDLDLVKFEKTLNFDKKT